VGQAAGEIIARLAQGDTIVLFAEGTSSDGNRVLPFMTSLFAAAKPSGETMVAPDAVVQTLSAVYTRLHGIPLGRSGRPGVAWYGDMEMRGHAWSLLKAGPLDVEIRVGPPVPLASFADRKELARHSEAQVRDHVVRILRARRPEEVLTTVAPQDAPSAVRTRSAAEPGQKWT
jgi:1-acyl-sn-glycerol-3-phosphate acyltransferase